MRHILKEAIMQDDMTFSSQLLQLKNQLLGILLAQATTGLLPALSTALYHLTYSDM